MNLLGGLFLLLVLPLGVLAMAGIAARISWAAALAGAVALLAAVAITAFWSSRPITGLVIGKTEDLDVADRGLNPRITHRFLLTVIEDDATFPLAPNHAGVSIKPLNPRVAALMRDPDSLRCEVEERVFDGVREGERIRLHLLSWGRLRFARLDAEPWWNPAPGRLERILPPPSTAAASEIAEARIVSVRTVRDAYLSWGSTSAAGLTHVSLAQPYDEVRLQFVTLRGASIIALDRIDSGSAGVLAEGSSQPIAYAVDRPRTARLVAGQRTYAWRNARSYWAGLGGLVLVGVLLIAAWQAARRRITVRRAGSAS